MLAVLGMCNLLAATSAPNLPSIVAADPTDPLDRPAANRSLIDAINSQRNAGSSWWAAVNTRLERATLRDVARMCGTVPESPATTTDNHTRAESNDVQQRVAALPDSFDWRFQPIAKK